MKAENSSIYTNQTLDLNITPSLDTYGTCPLHNCVYIFGTVADIKYRPGWNFNLNFVNCSSYFIDGPTLNSSYWQQVCVMSWDSTGDQVDSAILPVSVIKGLQLENQTQILSENKSLKTSNFWLSVFAGIFGIVSVIMIGWYWYTEHWQPAHEE